MKGLSFLTRFFVVGILLSIGSMAFATTLQEVRPVTVTEEVITLKIEGWTCASCEKGIRRALLSVPGVKHADVSYARGGAVVEVEPGLVSHEQLVRAVASAGNILSSYRASVVANGTLTAKAGEQGGGWNWFENLFK